MANVKYGISDGKLYNYFGEIKVENIKIINETGARRCEICHQSDQFDPDTGSCLRCNNVKPAMEVRQPDYYPKNSYNPFPIGIWRDDNVLLMHKQANLPDRCIKCNEYTNGIKIKKKLSWHSPYIYLILLLNLFIYLIVAAVSRKRATVYIPICAKHQKARSRAILISWAATGLGIISMMFTNYHSAFLFIGLATFVIGCIAIIISSQLVSVKKMDEHHIWLKNVNRDFVEQFVNINNQR